MGAKEAIIRSFRAVLADRPYLKITVTEICRQAHLSRKTFYDNFRDKEEIVEAIFEDGIVKPIRTMNEMLTTEQAKSMASFYMENIYVKILDDREYYQRLVRSIKGVDDTFLRIVTHSLERLNQEILSELTDIDDLEKEYIAYFFASSQAMLLQKWIFDGMPLTPKELGALYGKMTGPYWFSLR